MSLQRLLTHILAPAMGRRLAPIWLLLAMALGWLWQIIDWNGLLAGAAALSPLHTALAALGITGLMPLSERAALTPVFHAPALRILDRQPIPPLRWSVALLPWAMAAGIPAGLAALLWGLSWPPVAALLWSLTWTLIAGTVAVAASAPGWRGLALGTLTALVGASLIGVAWITPWAVLPVAATSLAASLATLGRLHRAGRRPTGRGARALPGRPATPLAALIREDLLGLLRQDGKTLAGPLLTTLLLAGYFAIPANNGCCTVDTLETGATILLTFGAAGGAGVLSALVARRGTTLDPATRPISTATRAAALQVVTALTTLPLLLALALLGGSWLGLIAHAWALTAGAVWIGTWRPIRPFNTGTYVAWSLLAGFSAVGAWPLSLALGVLASVMTTRRLAQHRRSPWLRA